MEKILIDRSRLYKLNDKDFHCTHGVVKAQDIKEAEPGEYVSTHKGHELGVSEMNFMDKYSKIKRGPQIIPRKDIGVIITYTGIGKKSVILDAGAGSGATCCFLANIAKKVISYEKREDFFNIASKNKIMFELTNLTIKNKDIYEGIKEKNIDVIILDLPEPWLVTKHAFNSLKHGGHIVCYTPTIPQVMDFVNSLDDFVQIHTMEIIQREWEVTDRKVRPVSAMMGHSGFLVFARKL